MIETDLIVRGLDSHAIASSPVGFPFAGCGNEDRMTTWKTRAEVLDPEQEDDEQPEPELPPEEEPVTAPEPATLPPDPDLTPPEE